MPVNTILQWRDTTFSGISNCEFLSEYEIADWSAWME